MTPFKPLLVASCLLAAACATPSAPPRANAAPAPTPQSAPVPPTGLRLPTGAVPLEYRVELSIAPASERFEGQVALELRFEKPTNVLWLNAEQLTVSSASLRLADGTVVAARAISAPPELVGFQFARTVGPGKATLEVRYEGAMSSTEDSGIFRQREGEDFYAFTQFEQTDARRAFPCFDEPAYKTPWTLSLRVPQPLLAVSNTPVASDAVNSDGTRTVRFGKTLPLPSYLVAFGVGPFDILEARPAGSKHVPVRVIAPRGRKSEGAEAARVAPELIEQLEQYFGIPYPYEKLDLLAIPVTVQFGAMENVGLVTFTTRYLLARPDEDSAARRRAIAEVAAHEFAHQWFGDLVTTAWWDDIWLNEAFATWMEQRVIATWAPSWGAAADRVQSRSRAEADDSLMSARRIRQPITSYDDIRNAFDSITYQKGAAVIGMFERYVGEETFQIGVRQYLRRHANGAATARDFLAAISEAAGRDIAPAFDTFLEQPGVPLLSMDLQCPKSGTPSLTLAQQRFLPVGSNGSTDALWQIPVCVRYGTGADARSACTLLTEKTGSLALPGAACPDWVLPNADGAGYYRVLPRGDLTERLLRHQQSLSVAERVSVLTDVGAQVQAGHTPQADALSLAAREANAKDRQVVEAALALGTVPEDFLPDDKSTARYAAWIRKTFGSRARRLGSQARPADDDDTRLLRPSVVGLVGQRGADPALIRAAKSLTDRWLQMPASVDQQMVDSNARIAARFGDAGLHERLVSAVTTTADRRRRAHLFVGLGAFRQPELVRKNLALGKNGTVDLREATALWTEGLSTPPVREAIFEDVRTNFDTYAEKLPHGAVERLFVVGSAFCNQAHRAEVATAFGPRAPDVLGGPRVLAQTLEQVDLCIARRAVQEPSVASFLAKTPRAPRTPPR